MKKIYLLRHGDTDATEKGYFAGWTDVPLSLKGKKRIDKVREILKGIEFERFFVSPLARARETIQLIAPSCNWEVREEIKERSFGSWEGRHWEDLEEEFPEEVRKWKEAPFLFVPPGGESFQAVLERVTPFWEELLHRPEEKVLVVTHGGVIRSIFAHLLGVGFATTSCFLFDPGVLVKIRGDHSFCQVVTILNTEVEP
ncbi:MAG TPA: histidine phosphatase family protein [Candidatus Atribacteria bacterium]|nr:histidine phosphatase family protein [Candidatus Atribacteria bacterium]